eukprot:COSAG04_NODE_658_length_11475_cov_3.480837_2_plen_791_part_00
MGLQPALPLLLAACAATTASDAAPPTTDAPPFGSGNAGRWTEDDGLPCYELAADTSLPNTWQSGFQLGNDRYVAIVGGDGSLSVRQDEGSPKFLTGQRPGWAAGVGYLQFSPQPFISGAMGLLGTRWPLNRSLASAFPTAPPALSREMCVGRVRKVAQTSDLTLDHQLIAPYGDDPVVISQVTVSNHGPTVWDSWYTEAWPSQWAHLEFFRSMAAQAKSNFSTFTDPARFAAEHYDVTHEKLPQGLVEHRRWKGLTDEEATEMERISAVLDSSNGTIAGLTPHAAEASVWDKRPPSVFLLSLDGPADRVGNDAAAFFGAGGASAPSCLVDQATEPSAARGLPWNESVCGDRSALLIARKIEGLGPGDSVTMRFLWGYEPGGKPEQSSFRDRMLRKYGAATSIVEESAAAWRNSSLRFETDEPSLSWVGRELAWHNYMLRAGTTYDDFLDARMVNQATSYLYASGLNAAVRDPLQHVLPLIATEPATAKGVLLATLRQLVKPDTWPAGFQRDLLPYSLMSHGLVWPDRERGPSDLDLYVLLTASEYVLQTRDVSFLSERVKTFTLFGGEGENHTVVECLLACFDHLVGPDIGLGEHGLLRMLTSDWSDVIYHDRAGLEFGSAQWNRAVQSGESVMNSALAAYVLPRFGVVLSMAGGHAQAAANVTAFGKEQAERLRRSAWTGQWFARAYVDATVGWIGDAEDQIETGAQPWAILAGVLDRRNASLLLSQIEQHLRNDAPFGAKQLAKGYARSTDDQVQKPATFDVCTSYTWYLFPLFARSAWRRTARSGTR